MENCLGKPKPTSSSDDIVCCGQVRFKSSDLPAIWAEIFVWNPVYCWWNQEKKQISKILTD
jgi:hypothetical protein